MRSSWRRPRGMETVQINAYVSPDVKARLDQVAAAADVPQWAVIEAALRAGTPGPNGIPREWVLEGPNGEPLPLELKKTA